MPAKPRKKKKLRSHSKLTPEVTKQIAKLVREGNYLTTAAQAAGIRARRVRQWMQDGAQPDALDEYRAFYESVMRAIADSESADVAQLGALAHAGDSRALMWRLERRHREHWGQKLTLVTEVREQAVEEILGRLRQRLDAKTFGAVLLALSDSEDGDEVPAEHRRH